MIKLDEKDLELINEFIKFLGEESQDTEYPVTQGMIILKDVENKTQAFKVGEELIPPEWIKNKQS